MTDLEIARSVTPLPIRDVAAKLGIGEDLLEYYGKTKAKLDPEALGNRPATKEKLILVTAINPTPLGEGKTTTSIGLADALARQGEKVCLALREPSLGPVFGIKGGAAGGGHAQVIPMEDINLHFTGDFHAITAANNLLAAMLDNHIQQGNAAGIDARTIMFPRCMDMNDRQLRHVIDGLGGRTEGVPREDKFVITVATEIMAVFCLATDLADLKKRLGDIVVAKHFDGTPVYARELGCAGAMAVLLKDAIKPNLVQTLEGTPAFVHGGPFANIAHGCNTIRATRLALKLADYTVTEAGFGADLGAEKFMDIKCRSLKRFPDCAVLVATIRALKYNGGVLKEDTGKENIEAMKKGFCNLKHHYETLTGVFGLPVCVAVNRFPTDTEAEIAALRELCAAENIPCALTEVWAKGGEGGLELADKVKALCESQSAPHCSYELEGSLRDKITAIVQKVYGGAGIEVSREAANQINFLTENGFAGLPVCIAKTQYSLTDDAKKLGCPTGFTVQVKTVRVSAGAGFVVAETGTIMTMPGLPKKPAALSIDISDDGEVSGLF